MIDLNDIMEDFSNLQQNEEVLEILHKRISSTFDLIDQNFLELYSDSDNLASYFICNFFKMIEADLEYYQIAEADAYYDSELNEYFEEGEEYF